MQLVGAVIAFGLVRFFFPHPYPGVHADALSRAKSLEGKDVAAAIAETKDFHGVTGDITINAQRNADKPAVMLQYKGGKWKFVGSVPPITK